MGAEVSRNHAFGQNSYHVAYPKRQDSNPVAFLKKQGPKPVLTFHKSSEWRAYFETTKSSKKLIVIDFGAAWCGPCRVMEPFYKELATKFPDVEFVKLDVDELMDVADEWEIQAMPTFILVKQGRVVEKVVGARKDDLAMKVEKYRL
ncbi:hypothetical protein AMTRI_Chr03g147350 [Amborella trichopoda]|uniref:Thioredoxin domain-containing protein n=1 Tax=Amborella trichopoda TaxID=13333 RepID=W1P0A1_AMBTC|nr:thioredoxin H-type [Amborella trichopoda]ERN01363.1 hypothetical protein AMTR_s00002p00259770 [Amborella trichopoda]|eukprot:XP_006838794.1 thioredoxin H-type [Amborella trichopoda]